MRSFHIFLTMASMSLLAGCAGPDSRPDPVAKSMVILPQASADAGAGKSSKQLQRLTVLAPDLDPGVIALALEARSCAVRNGAADADARLAVIDYSRASTEKRLWVFDMASERLLYREYVAHGSGSGDNFAKRFSNIEGSYQTSLGLFRTAETYMGKNGYSLRMDGLDPGFNDNARPRAIVMHGAWYANPELIRSQGRLGRSQGCPALREQIAKVVIDDLKQRNLVFAYADDATWLRTGRSFACDGRSAAQILAMGRSASPENGQHEGIAAI
ncbi:MAG: murein L,D-transpeptidase catalytic domain family protein [Thermomonas sp.]